MGVIFAAVTITALGIDATDTLNGKGGTILGQLVATESGVCPKGMVKVPGALSFTCIDKYESSAGKDCPSINPTEGSGTQDNMNSADCEADSKDGVLSWRFVTREQSQVACVRAGKRLPNSKEWYIASIGTIDSSEACNVSSNSVKKTNADSLCVSASGAVDMIGNV